MGDVGDFTMQFSGSQDVYEGEFSLTYEYDEAYVKFTQPIVAHNDDMDNELHMLFMSKCAVLPWIHLTDNIDPERKTLDQLTVLYEHRDAKILVHGFKIDYIESAPWSESAKFVDKLEAQVQLTTDINIMIRKFICI